MDTEQFAWREIVLRIFEGFDTQRDVSPSWLTNPETGFRNSYLLPGRIALRLEGLRGREQRRGPDEVERLRQREREVAREKACDEHGIRLVRFEVHEEPAGIFRALNMALAWASRQTAKSDLDQDKKLALMERLRLARERSEEIRAAVHSPRDLQTWAELSIDRAYQEARNAPAPVPTGPTPRYAMQMRVRHRDFGTGRVSGLSDERRPDRHRALDTARRSSSRRGWCSTMRPA